MRSYAKVSPKFWTSGSGRRLRGDLEAQALALHLLTGPSSTMIGLYYLPLPTMAHELGTPPDRVSVILDRVSASGFASYDRDTDLVWVHNAADFEFGDGKKIGPKLAAGICKQLIPFGNHRFVSEFLRRYGERYQIACPVVPGAQNRPSPDRVSGFGHQDQGQDQDQGQGFERRPPPPIETTRDALALDLPSRAVAELFDHYQDELQRVRHVAKVLMPPATSVEQARPVLVNAGGDIGLAKAVVTALVESDHGYWADRHRALWLIGNPRDFEQARLAARVVTTAKKPKRDAVAEMRALSEEARARWAKEQEQGGGDAPA